MIVGLGAHRRWRANEDAPTFSFVGAVCIGQVTGYCMPLGPDKSSGLLSETSRAPFREPLPPELIRDKINKNTGLRGHERL